MLSFKSIVSSYSEAKLLCFRNSGSLIGCKIPESFALRKAMAIAGIVSFNDNFFFFQ